MSYRSIDTLATYQIEPGDLIKNHDGEVIQVFKVNHFNDYSEVVYLDDFFDEELSFTISDDTKTELFMFDEEQEPQAHPPQFVKLYGCDLEHTEKF